MRNLLIIALMLITSVLTAQIDTTVQIDMSKNVSRSAPLKHSKPFTEVLNDFRIESGISYITLVVLYSNVATKVHGYRIEYTIDEIIRMEQGVFFPFPKVQKDIRKMINSYYP